MSSSRSAELRAAFDLFDKDGDGRITADELSEVIASLTNTKPDRAQAMIAAVDVDNNGTVEFDEFEKCMAKFMPAAGASGAAEGDVLAHWRSVFDTFDTNRDGMISVAELFEMMKKFGNAVSMEEAAELHKSVDLNGDGQIDFSEFQKMMSAV